MNQRKTTRLASLETLEPRRVLAAAPVISEFVASNESSAEDGFGSDPDWIELYNAGDESIDLLGYHLTDDAEEPTRWTFPESVNLDPGEFLLVFASGLDRQDPAGFWHTNFKLGANGEYLALKSPNGATLSQFGSATSDYPAQFTDVSFGLGGTQLVSSQSVAEYWIPTSGGLDSLWMQPDFDAIGVGFTLGRAAIGYETTTNSTAFTDYIETELPSGTTNVYIRNKFQLADAALPDLSLNLLLDDGLVIYLNGTQIYTNQDEAPVWNSTSNIEVRDRTLLEGFDIDLTEHIDLLQDGENVLAFHLLNRSATSSDLLISPLLTTSLASDTAGYLSEPTPGLPNKSVIELGPAIRDVTLETENPNHDQPLVVTATVSPTVGAVANNSVTLHYRVMFEGTNEVQMFDNGQGADAEANDGVFTGTIPADIATAGEMIRWNVTAQDVEMRETREPRFADPLDSAEYFGTVIPDPTESTDVPVIHWFVRSASAARTRTGTRASLSIGGEFYDNVKVDLHGQSTSSFVKTSYDFDANQGQKFKIADEYARVSDINLLTNYGDQTKLRNSLGYGAHAASGGSAHFTFPVSVHQNGEFFGLYDIVEQGDVEFLERIGRDPNGALYKVNNRLDSNTTNVDKVSRKWEGNDDLQELVDANSLSNSRGLVWDYDNLDIADLTNYLAVQSLIMNKDFGHKNMYWYYDADGTELWSVIPWDVDLSFGHHWNSSDTYFDDTLFTTGTLRLGINNLFQRFYSDDRLEAMYYRRLRTLMDDQLGAEGSPILESFVAKQTIELEAQIADEALRDYEKWGIHRGFTHTPSEAAQQLLDEYFEQRRSYLERQRRIPDPHGIASDVEVLVIEHAPESGRADQQYIQLHNNESFDVDISGWKLGGASEHTFKSGSVIPAHDSLYLVASPAGFKARTSGPTGGQKLFLQGNTSGQIGQVSGAITLSNSEGTNISAKTFGATPLRGDTNSDGVIDVMDIDTLRTAIADGKTDAKFDLNDDQSVNTNDFDVLVSDILQVKPGDANFDGTVDFTDFLIISANFGESDQGWADGNFDDDHTVSFADFLSLSAFFGRP